MAPKMPFSPRPVASFLLALTLGLVACDQPGPDLGPLTLAVAVEPGEAAPSAPANRGEAGNAAPAGPSSRVVWHWELGDPRHRLPEDWAVLAGEYEIERAPRGARGPAGAVEAEEAEEATNGGRQMLAFEDSLTLRIRGPFDPQRFNQVVVSLEMLTFRDTFDIGLRGMRKGVKDLETVKTVRGEKGPKPIVFDLGQLLREDRDYDQFTLFVRGASRIGIRAVDFVHKPVAAWLPRLGAPRPVLVGDEARPAFALTSRHSLVASFTGGPGLRLSFSCARPRFVSRRGERPQLIVTLTSAGAVLAQRTVAVGGAEKIGWREVQLSFDVEPGTRVEARFELRARGRAEGTDQPGAEGTEQPGSRGTDEPVSTREVFCALTTPEVWVPVEQPPTVVLVTVDTHRADHVGGARNGAGVHTPFLDELAARGVFFEDCFASANITIPSHATLLTGLTPRDTGVVTNTAGLSLAAHTLAEAFRAEGFSTFAATSVGHLRDDPSGFAQGFDRFVAPQRNDVAAGVTIERLAAWLPEADGRPLFVWLHLFDVHAPYRPPEESLARYWPADRDPYDPALPELPAAQQTRWDPELRDVEYHLARYKGEVSFVDDRLREALGLARLEHAIVAVTSDHGEALGQHGFWFNHSNLYPATAGVPLVIAWPAAEGGQRVAAPVRQLDVGRTLLDLAGLAEAPFPGRDLLGDAAPSAQRFGLSSGATAATLSEDHWFMSLRLRKLTLPGTDVRFELHQAELFDLQADPDCLDDVVAEHPQVARRMRALIAHWLQSRSEDSLAQTSNEQDAERLAELAALGYATDGAPAATELFDPECECDYCLESAR